MKRLILGITLAIVGAGFLAPAAQAAPTLTMNEAKWEILTHGISVGNRGYFGGAPRNCSRLATNRIRCSTRIDLEIGSGIKRCRSRLEVVEHAEIKVRTIRRKCRDIKVPYLTYERAMQAAAKAMDPKATHPDYELGMGGGSIGKNRFLFEATWVTEKDQTCLQTARVRLVKKKVLVNVSEVACVDDPEWPKAGN